MHINNPVLRAFAGIATCGLFLILAIVITNLLGASFGDKGYGGAFGVVLAFLSSLVLLGIALGDKLFGGEHTN